MKKKYLLYQTCTLSRFYAQTEPNLDRGLVTLTFTLSNKQLINIVKILISGQWLKTLMENSTLNS